jgi:spore germination cell wall hydrolase CwlJ-like protein
MRQIWVVTCLATILIVVQACAVDRSQKVEGADKKAGALEQNSAANGSKTPPSRSEIITKTEAQAIDPVGEEPLDNAITCLSRTIYWEAKSEGAASMEAIASVVMNRLGHKGFSNTICGVVKQGHEPGCLPVLMVVRWPFG